MKIFLFVILTYVMGFISAVPVGAVQIEVARRAVTGHLRAAIVVVIGSLVADVLYGAVAFFGIAPFLRQEKVMAVFWLAGAVVLIIIGISVIRKSFEYQDFHFDSTYLRKKRLSFVAGFSLSMTNPMMVLWWLLGKRIIEDLGLIAVFTPGVALSFLIIGGLGLSSYLGAVAFFLFWINRFISPRMLMRVSLASGVLLLFLAVYFLVSSLVTLL